MTDLAIGSDFVIPTPEEVEAAIAKVNGELKAAIADLRAASKARLVKLRMLLRTARKIHGVAK
jgi:hypothetical protein